MKKGHIKLNRVTFPLTTVAIIASQLMGCGSATSSEFMNAVNNRQAVEVMVEIPEDVVHGTEQETSWEQLDQLNTYSSFRRNFDDALGITKYGTDSKNGIMYADLEGNHEGNNTLYNGFANNKFRENYWTNDAVQLQVQTYAAEQFADVEKDSNDAKMAALNAYYNLFNDADPNYFNGSSLISRAEFMTGLFKAETQAGTIESDKAFSDLVGSGELADFATALVSDSYLDTTSKSLNEKTFEGTMTRGEAVYMLVSHYYGDELANASGKSDKVDVKNAGDVETKQKFTGDYSRSYELVYCMQNINDGAPDEIYRALQVAYDKGILEEGEESRWEEGLTKTEALEFITDTYMSMPSVHGVLMGKGDGTALEDIEESEAIADTDFVVETETPEEEEYLQSLVESGEASAEVKEIEIIDMDATMYAVQDVNLRQGMAVTTESLRLVQFGEKIKVTGQSKDEVWYRVFDEQKGEGYIAADYLSETEPAQNQSAVQTQQAQQGGGEQKTQGGWTAEEQASLDLLDELLKDQQPNMGQTMTPAGEGGGAGRGWVVQ